MIYSLRGKLAVCTPGFAVIECAGVGYRVMITGNTLGKIASKLDSEVFLLTYMKVSEDAVDLYGFAEEEELNLFKMLISVSGVGAKMALSVLTLMTPERFAMAVGAGDSKAISKAPGVGAKTAARIILELKDKIAKGFPTDALASTEESNDPSGVGGLLGDAVDTLLVLGYKRSEAMAALNGINAEGMGLEDIIKAALKKLARN